MATQLLLLFDVRYTRDDLEGQGKHNRFFTMRVAMPNMAPLSEIAALISEHLFDGRTGVTIKDYEVVGRALAPL